MRTARLSLPAEISARSPHGYVSVLNDPSTIDLVASNIGGAVVVTSDDHETSIAAADWKLRMPNSAIAGALISAQDFMGQSFIGFSLMLGTGGDGVALLVGPRTSAAWFRELAAILSPHFPGGVRWSAP
jgi:hypothetical protein